MPINPALRSKTLEHHWFEASLGYMRSCVCLTHTWGRGGEERQTEKTHGSEPQAGVSWQSGLAAEESRAGRDYYLHLVQV